VASEHPVPGAPAVYELIFIEARRALDDQEAALADARSRTGVLLSAAAIATSFLGGQALKDGSASGWTWVALVLFCLVAGLSLFVLWPARRWSFSLDPAAAIAGYAESADPPAIEQVHRDFALYMGSTYDAQEPQLERLLTVFRLATLGLAAEVVAWFGDLALAS